ncbi:MAG TPA: GNAT family N-acetyltransferase [Roseateles sp.]|uniref:GNAT family N-acetyltransferase n=1 Tax=Roseateles sp. TaxID=1971397 RepID=UPI002ED85491
MSSDLTPCLAPVDPGHPDARALIAQSEALASRLYPAESNHFEPPEGLRGPDGSFWGCWLGDTLVGCGGVKHLAPPDGPSYGEIKRLFVLESLRGRGIAKLLMARLEGEVLARGVHLVRLETGIYQPEAIALYQRLGYVAREPFGEYAVDPLSVFFERVLRLCAP